MTAHISYGQNGQDSINHYSIKQSIKCFEEQKSLKVIIQQKDSIIMAITKYDMMKETELLDAAKKLDNDKRIAEQKAIKLQNKNYLLTTALVFESIILGLMIIF
jgi:hypothetical protein